MFLQKNIVSGKTICIALFLFIMFFTLSLHGSEKSNFSGEWILIKFEKIDKGRRTEVQFEKDTVVIEDNGLMLKQTSGPDPGVFKLDNEWHKFEGKKIKAYWSLDGTQLFRMIKKKSDVSQQIHEMRSLIECGALMEIDRKISTLPSFFSSVTGLGMPHEEYDKREILLYRKK
ncbi:hypothetical protein ACFL27_07735 [candidate division CSSED10-310 bacterium]|uniref:Lipocalin-like domain-containing protein n=1 Tax=candidate division CSSED10-310 bacterium TaxID=2855610 RepID=A0ABV6YVE1_UNCC1